MSRSGVEQGILPSGLYDDQRTGGDQGAGEVECANVAPRRLHTSVCWLSGFSGEWECIPCASYDSIRERIRPTLEIHMPVDMCSSIDDSLDYLFPLLLRKINIEHLAAWIRCGGADWLSSSAGVDYGRAIIKTFNS
jgi:hypothetical protein